MHNRIFSLVPLIFGVAGWLLCAAGCSKGPPNAAVWREFVQPDGAFSVELAGKANEEVQEHERGLVSKTYHIVTVLNNVRGMAVGYADLPSAPRSPSEARQILDRTKEQTRENLGGDLLNETDISLGSYRGKEIQLLLPKRGHVVRQRIYVGNRRIYNIMAITSRENIECAEARRFFDSFKILE